MLKSYSTNGTLHLILDDTEGSIDLHQVVLYLNRTLNSSMDVSILIIDTPDIDNTFTLESLDLLFKHSPITKLTLVGQRAGDGSDGFVELIVAWLREEYNYPIYLSFLNTLPLSA